MVINLLVTKNKIIFAYRKKCGNSSVGRALASQAEGRGFESRLPLYEKYTIYSINILLYLNGCW